MSDLDTIIHGDSLAVLKTIPDGCVNCCVTSPPYWGLRDYGVTGQMGLEKSPEEYLAGMVAVFREVRRVLRDDGTLWLNLGDSYWNNFGGVSGTCTTGNADALKERGRSNKPKSDIYKIKDLVGIPWMVAFALRADGWYLRQDIIWAKPNPMPESVTDRCTKSHEYIFLLSKSAKYYYDSKSISEQSIDGESLRGRRPRKMTQINVQGGYPNGAHDNFHKLDGQVYETRNKRSVWTVTTKPYKEAHFATFPPDLITPCVLAGCPVGGVVLDPFMGAGTTAIVAVRNKRHYIGIELNEKYIAMANRRISKETPCMV